MASKNSRCVFCKVEKIGEFKPNGSAENDCVTAKALHIE